VESIASYAGPHVKRRFSPPPWAWTATALGLVLFLNLGAWQLRRAHEKEHLLASYSQAAFQPASELHVDTPTLEAARVMPVLARGRYLVDKQLLLDGQSHGGRPGYRVWTPLALASGGVVVVDRGWIAGDPQNPTNIAVESSARVVHGLWRDLPRPGLRLSTAHSRVAQSFPRIVEYPTVEDLKTMLGDNVAAGVLLLDAGEPDGFVREWNPSAEFPPSRHYAYAAQWFALAAALIAIFVVVNRRSVS